MYACWFVRSRLGLCNFVCARMEVVNSISMDFVVGLSKSTKGFDSFWVIVDRLSKSVHLIPIKITYPM